MNNELSGVEILVGEELNTVAFVMDYVEFHFNGPVLRALANPTVTLEGEATTFPEPGARDALCRLIGREVTSVRYLKEDRIALELVGGARLTIPLDAANYHGAEAAHFLPKYGGPLQVYE
jgi:hypothetical protein